VFQGTRVGTEATRGEVRSSASVPHLDGGTAPLPTGRPASAETSGRRSRGQYLGEETPGPQGPLGPRCFLPRRPSWRKCRRLGLRPKACSLWRLNSRPPSVTVGPSSRAFLPRLRCWGTGFSGGGTRAASSCAGGLSGSGRFPWALSGAGSCARERALSPCGFPVASVGVSVLETEVRDQ
jgi:hypothetical protein